MKAFSLTSLLSSRLERRGIAFAVVFSLFVLGVAHAAHFHKDEFGPQHAQVHVDCALCLFMSGSAGPPAGLALGDEVPPTSDFPPYVPPSPQGIGIAPYDARGPPQA